MEGVTVAYDFKKMQDKWSQLWLKNKLYAAEDFSKKPKKYVLVEFPYPSAAGLHMGHCKNYSMLDAYSRFHRMKGFNVLYPMGWDAFGLPTYNYAIKVKRDPHDVSSENTVTFKRQLQSLGISFDWDREIDTSDSQYYKWTQWIFVKLFDHYYDTEFIRKDGGKGQARPIVDLKIPEEISTKGEEAVRAYKDSKRLAFKAKQPVYWCPFCKTGVANEEVTPEGTHERCDVAVEKRDLEQWLLRITAYADRLVDDLLTVDYPESVRNMQRHWIGRSYGINISYDIKGLDKKITVFTTKPETNFGATFIVAAPDSEFVKENIKQFPESEKVAVYAKEAESKSEMQRVAEGKKKTGVFTGWYAINQLTGKEMPVYVSDFVLGSFGTGVVVGVPGHDIRDFEFAEVMGIETIRVIIGPDGDETPITKREQVQEEEGHITNSDFLNGMEIEAAREKIMSYIIEKGYGTKVTSYKLHDWIFSRQHYWGEPTPMIHCEKCGWNPVSVFDLPVELPRLPDYTMGDDGSSPLERAEEWKKVKCPICAGEARRETDVMPNWAGSDWYYVRYLDPKNGEKMVDLNKASYWMPVDIYDGGWEHVTLHLLYSRFIYKFLFDLGSVPGSEPYAKRRNHGVVLGPDNKKMSKSKGNVVNPDEMVDKYGADIVRMYVMFMGPYEANIAWSEKTLNGVRRFLNRVFIKLDKELSTLATTEDKTITAGLAKLSIKITDDLPSLKFNTAIAAMMEFFNSAEKITMTKGQVESFLKLIAPFAPFLAEEMWERLGNTDSVHSAMWPEFEASVISSEQIEIPVQINGKIRGRITVSPNAEESEVMELVKKNEGIASLLTGEIKKVIYLKGKMVSLVV